MRKDPESITAVQRKMRSELRNNSLFKNYDKGKNLKISIVIYGTNIYRYLLISEVSLHSKKKKVF